MSFKHILLIDDDEDDQEIFLTALAMASPSVACVPMDNARDALHQLAAQKISTDVIFLDLNMPIMNGQQFLAEIKSNPDLKHIPVVIFSTSSHLPTIELTKQLGAMKFITKPDKFDDLISILRSFLA